MPLQANTTNQTNAIMLQQQTYSTLPQEFVMYNALSGNNNSNYAHYERATIGWATMSATSAFAINVTAKGEGINRDLYFMASSANRIVLNAGGLSTPTSLIFVSGTYTIALSDNGTVLASAASASSTVNITYSPSVSYPLGFNVGILSLGTGIITLVPQGSDVIHQVDGVVNMSAQYGAGTLMWTGNSPGAGWVAFGNFY